VLTFFGRKEYCGDVNVLRLLRGRCRDHIYIVLVRLHGGGSRDTFLAVTRPVLLARDGSEI
jgi:hypothetical protein